jgi:hypothetical protein
VGRGVKADGCLGWIAATPSGWVSLFFLFFLFAGKVTGGWRWVAAGGSVWTGGPLFGFLIECFVIPGRCNCRGGGMASAIPPPYVPFTPGSSSLLDVLRLGTPSPFSSSLASSIPVFVLVFCYITFMFVSMFFRFFFFFTVSVDLLHDGFVALHPLLDFFHAPTVTSFHRALLCKGSVYKRSVSFPVFIFVCI